MPSSTIPASGGGGLAPKYVKYTSSGTFTLPDGYGAAKPLLITIQVIGGGGGGKGEINATNSVSYSVGQWGYFGGFIRNVSISTPMSNSKGNLGGGGSGGIAQTQMYLTANLTITVGAAGTRGTTTYTGGSGGTGGQIGINNPSANSASNPNLSYANVNSPTGGTGGTSSAGAVFATGGVGGSAGTTQYGVGLDQMSNSTTMQSGRPEREITSSAVGAGGTPAGTAGQATPLLGTIAGGSADATSIKGSFGVGGISTDTTTTTGVEGTGGGRESVGGSGAVIITYWA